jgi:hypothetical protein
MPVLLKVGEPYMGKKRGWPQGAQYNFDAAGHILQLFFERPTMGEVQAIQKEKIELALYVTDDDQIIELAYSAPGIPWSDAPYYWHLVPHERRAMPQELEGEQRPLLEIHLVDTATGLLRAIRKVSMSPAFGARLHEAIRAQAAAPADVERYRARLAGLMARLGSETIASMAQVRCTGGD